MVILKYIHKIVDEAAAIRTKQEKINFLRKNGHPIIINYLRMACDKNLQWALPEGAPPYTCKKEAQRDSEFMLYNEYKWICRVFLKGGHPTLTDRRRQQLFQAFLEDLHEGDAKFFIDVVKAKKLPKGLSKKILDEAWPGFLASIQQ